MWEEHFTCNEEVPGSRPGWGSMRDAAKRETDGKPWTVSVNRYCVVCHYPVHSTKEEYKAWGRTHAPWGPCYRGR